MPSGVRRLRLQHCAPCFSHKNPARRSSLERVQRPGEGRVPPRPPPRRALPAPLPTPRPDPRPPLEPAARFNPPLRRATGDANWDGGDLFQSRSVGK